MKLDPSNIIYQYGTTKFNRVDLATAIQGHFTPLQDHEVPDSQAITLWIYRQLATKLGYLGIIAWHVKQGFNLYSVVDSLTYGPVFADGQELAIQDGKINPYVTSESFVFYIPRPVRQSTRCRDTLTDPWDINRLRSELLALRKELKLPASQETTSDNNAAQSQHLILGDVSLHTTLLLEIYMRTDTIELPPGIEILSDSQHLAGRHKLPVYLKKRDSIVQPIVCGFTAGVRNEQNSWEKFGAFHLGIEYIRH